ncbi:MAG: protein-L-isoaspartate O-methyltransferase family protein [Gammaproteobacteria bacterium]
MNFEQARFNMIEQQVRTWEVLDQRVLDLIGAVPREDFVPEPYRRLAFSDTGIPLGYGEVMMAPRVEARMLQSLDIGAADKILEIGTGSGYVTALLARSGNQATSVEIRAEFAQRAEARLRLHDIGNVVIQVANGIEGWERAGPYDAIAVTGSLPILSEVFQEQLRVGGRLFVIVGESPVMEARLITRVGRRAWASEALFETDLPPLQGAPTPKRFVF